MCGRITSTFEFSEIRLRWNLDRDLPRYYAPWLTLLHSPWLAHAFPNQPCEEVIHFSAGKPILYSPAAGIGDELA